MLKTLPQVETVSVAALIAEIGPLLERCENPEQVAAMCGAAPVTKTSGKSRNVGFRYTANKPARVTRLRGASRVAVMPVERAM